MLNFAHLDNQGIVLGTGNLQPPVTICFNVPAHRSYYFELTTKLDVKIT